jgi:mannitol-1-phosphate 5-dehydrogenase
MNKKIVVFGAGATGRGHVGLLCWQAGYDMVFVDKNDNLVNLLSQNGSYQVRLYGNGFQQIKVDGFRVYHAEDRQAIADEIIDAELVLTAVFDQNLPDVSKTLALAVAACQQSGRQKPLNIIACENMMDSSSTLGNHIRGLLPPENIEYFEKYFGFPDCMISRVVPRPEPDPLFIVTEDYNEWTTRAEAFKGEKPYNLDALELVENQTARLERKLFIHNGGHATCGYKGYHRHHIYIHEALLDPVVVEHVLGALDELGEIIRIKYGFSQDSIDHYKQDLGRRGAIPEMKDSILRVVRDPLRKLSPRERLVAPALQAVEFGLPRRWIVKAIVSVLKYKNPSDTQSLELALMLEEKGLGGVLNDICSISKESPLFDEIQQEWESWSN